jgi:hypothetical protein
MEEGHRPVKRPNLVCYTQYFEGQSEDAWNPWELRIHQGAELWCWPRYSPCLPFWEAILGLPPGQQRLELTTNATQ